MASVFSEDAFGALADGGVRSLGRWVWGLSEEVIRVLGVKVFELNPPTLRTFHGPTQRTVSYNAPHSSPWRRKKMIARKRDVENAARAAAKGEWSNSANLIAMPVSLTV